MNGHFNETAVRVVESVVEFEGKQTKVVVTDYSNLFFVVATDIGKIGQLVQIDWPQDSLASSRHSSAAYDSKLLLGVETPETDIVIRKLAEAVASKNRGSKRLLLGVAFEQPSPEQIGAVCEKLRSLL
uniref:Proteasome assembly chaperone 3 n=1 Tax=Plectus sambesii TaxID=2011161 RepID=A0A914WX68_9BILA